MKKILVNVFMCLTETERRRSLRVLALMVLTAVCEVIGVASVLPFMAVINEPSLIESQPALKWAYQWGKFTELEGFLIFLGVSSFMLLIVAALVRSVTMFEQSRFTENCRDTLGCRLLAGYLNQPYEFFFDRNGGDMGKNILSEVDIFVERALLPAGYMISFSMIMLAMTMFLLIVDAGTTLVVAGSLGGFYLVVSRIIRKRLARIGVARAEGNKERFQAASEALGGIKAVKTFSSEAFYLARFSGGSKIIADSMATSTILGQIPKYAVETFAFGGIILSALIVIWREGIDGNFSTLLPVLSLYAFAGYRMLPAVQGIFSSASTIRFSSPAVKGILNELAGLEKGQIKNYSDFALPLRDSIEFREVSFNYAGGSAGLRGVSFVLKRGEVLGIVGRTGSGKTTLVDVLLGLLVPKSGFVLVDGVPLDSERRGRWQRSVGYVPQDIFLMDASLKENIAFGIEPALIDQVKVERAATIAQLHTFVISDLPNGYETQVGERGVRLSGGQRQRIGIARALYTDPDIVVFDEATSALDALTEAEVMQSLKALSGIKTLILIAHRTGTLTVCDRVMELENGKILVTSI